MFSGVDQDLLHQCEAQHTVDCEKTVPGLAACVAARDICDVRVQQEMDEQRSKALAKAGGPMTSAAAIATALQANPNATSSSPVSAKEMTLAAYNKASGESLSENGPAAAQAASHDALVWVVNVEADMYTDGSPHQPPTLEHSYSVIYDVQTHQSIELCIGCKALP